MVCNMRRHISVEPTRIVHGCLQECAHVTKPECHGWTGQWLFYQLSKPLYAHHHKQLQRKQISSAIFHPADTAYIAQAFVYKHCKTDQLPGTVMNVMLRHSDLINAFVYCKTLRPSKLTNSRHRRLLGQEGVISASLQVSS